MKSPQVLSLLGTAILTTFGQFGYVLLIMLLGLQYLQENKRRLDVIAQLPAGILRDVNVSY